MKQVLCALILLCTLDTIKGQPLPEHNLSAKQLPIVWDEGHHLGNGMLGALIWHNKKNLRFSLDRADLWDERPAVDFKNMNYQWVYQQVINNNYSVVQKFGDIPYEEIPYPTKIPGAALEFPIDSGAEISTDSVSYTHLTLPTSP
jgi:alpha-L-fucosidase 2